ncbi:MAG: hypothetical protein K2X86_06245 [Cytophagaceae bacterium]|nr:hypothetical protein [Cytophagaceae bacterium]
MRFTGLRYFIEKEDLKQLTLKAVQADFDSNEEAVAKRLSCFQYDGVWVYQLLTQFENNYSEI